MRRCVMRDPDSLQTSKHWLDRAKECRALADSFRTHVARERMRKVAEDYQRMGDQAAARELAEAHGVEAR